jgi:hypothetical protein
MPDLSDVENVIVSKVTQILYPNGTAAASATGDPIKVYRGWPIQQGLDKDLKAKTVNVSVFPMDVEQNVTRGDREWMELPSPPITLTLSVDGDTVTVGGKPCCPLNAAVLVNGRAFVYPLQATDTPTSIATALAALINAETPATSEGAVVTVPSAKRLETRLGSVGLVAQEVKRQKKGFRITVWCHDPMVRDAVCAVLDPALADLSFLSLSDGTSGRIRYERTHTVDNVQRSGAYRRDFDYSVEFATTIVHRAADVVSEVINVTTEPDGESQTINI